jgi:hypothetical protein
VRFTGDLGTTKPVAAVADRTVTLWARSVGSSTWTRVGSDVTDAAGHYDTSVAVPRSADYQARWVGGSTYAASASPLVRLTTPARAAVAIDLHKNATTVTKGAPLMLYGHTTSGGEGVAGLSVRYYKRMPSGGAWVYVGRSTSKAPTGWHSIVVHPKITRVWKAVSSGTSAYAPRTSSYLTVRPR